MAKNTLTLGRLRNGNMHRRTLIQVLLISSFLSVFFLSPSGCKHRVRDSLDDIVNVLHNRTTLPDIDHDPYLSSFVDEFVRDARDNGVEIPNDLREMLRVIKFVKKLSKAENPTVMATCIRFKQQTSSKVVNRIFGTKEPLRWFEIEVHRERAERFTQKKRVRMRELIYHELYHCYLYKGHLPSKYPGIMNASFKPGDLRSYKDWKGLVQDLFSEEFRNLTPDIPM